MSKQDRQGVRTATDLEQKYNFGQSFAEVYGLAADAQKVAQEAESAVTSLDKNLTPEEIFNRLTNYGQDGGIYRDADEKIYINANYIKSGTVNAKYIDTESLNSKVGNFINGLTVGGASATDAEKGAVAGITTIVKGTVTADFVNALKVSATYVSASGITSGTLNADSIGLNGIFAVSRDNISYGYMGGSTVGLTIGVAMTDNTGKNYVLVNNTGAKLSFYDSIDDRHYQIYVARGGCWSNYPMQEGSDKRLKNTIDYEMAEMESVFAKLKPCSYYMNSDPVRKRYGLIAQDVVEAFGTDEGLGLIAKSEDGTYGLAYSELIAVNTHMIQKLMKRVEALEGRE